MQKGFYTLGSLIILLIAAVVFVLLPAMLGRGGGKRLPPFGRYDGHEIRYENGTVFADYVSNYADMIKERGGDVDTQAYFYIFNYAFNATVQRMVFDEAVKKSGYTVPEAAVDRMMVPYFSENGVYSPKLYRQASEDSIRKMRKEFSETLTTSRYTDDALGAKDAVGEDALYGLKVSKGLIKTIVDMGKEKRGLSIASYSMADYPDAEKVKYGKAHAEKFKKYDMSVITFEEKATAESVAKRIAGNEINFFDAIGEYSKKTYSDENGKLNSAYRYQVEKIVSTDSLNALDALKEGEVSSVIETDGTWSLFRADGGIKTPDFSDDNVVRDVYSYLNTYESSIIEDYFVEKAKGLAQQAAQGTFEEACAALSLEYKKVMPFALNYGSEGAMSKLDTSIKGLEGADMNDAFLKEVFSLKVGEVSSPIVNGSNVLVARLDTIEREDLPPSKDAIKDMCAGMNREAMSAAIMASDKLENNLISVFFNNFMDKGD